MMLGTGDHFEYLNCSNCHCLQLINAPDDMGRYYPSDYYSYDKKNPKTTGLKINAWLRKIAMRNHLGIANRAEMMIGRWRTVHFPWLLKGLVRLDSKILDVGCGNGFLIREMSHYGFDNLTGLDPFLSEGLANNGESFKVLRAGLEMLEESDFDLVMFHHSFEHLKDPLEQLKAARARVVPDGTVLIRTPVANSFAFRKYRQYWAQLDAPRHYFVHTVASIRELCNKAGFVLEKVIYDSNSFQFSGSECYLRNLRLNASNEFLSKGVMHTFQMEAERLNAIHDGDSACFYLRPQTQP
jgi:2-polyprenyl-3-methyl-5-hydroxy-6-metoxy-1,4-benzoquinol methylase